jgi:AraC-like DNA-binding protein
MLTHERIFNSPVVRIFEVACSAARGGCGDVETVTRAKVVVPRRGVFSYHFTHHDDFVADANSAIVLRPGENYKVSHPIDGGDRCTVFEFDDDLFAALSGAVGLPAAGAFAAGLARGGALAKSDALFVEERALAFLESMRSLQSRPRHDIVERAKETISRDPFDDRSLGDIARDVGASPFYLTRTFKRTTGLSLHAYRIRLRLQRGLERALEGEHLAAVALDCGFSNHSQFTAAFRKHFGAVPSHVRKISIAG